MDLSLRVPRSPSGSEEEHSPDLDEIEDEEDEEDEADEADGDAVLAKGGNGRGNGHGNGHGNGRPLASDLQLFLDGIGRYRLLTAADEVELAKRIERGDSSARDRMITSNLRLVVSIAKRYRIPEASGLTLLDLVQDGIIGLMRAVELYDWRTGNRFSTYASFWIRQSIGRALMLKGQTVRVPTTVHARMRAVARAEQELRSRLGREPLEAETARQAGVTVEELRTMRHRSATVSLDQTVEDGSSRLGELIPAEEDVFEDVYEQLNGVAMRKAVARLPRRLRELIVLRYGMNGDEPKTLAEIGRRFGLTRERVRQLERKALDELAPAAAATRAENGAIRRTLRDRVSAFDPGSLVTALKSMLAASASTNVATGVAVVASAGVVAPVAVNWHDSGLPSLRASRERPAVTVVEQAPAPAPVPNVTIDGHRLETVGGLIRSSPVIATLESVSHASALSSGLPVRSAMPAPPGDNVTSERTPPKLVTTEQSASALVTTQPASAQLPPATSAQPVRDHATPSFPDRANVVPILPPAEEPPAAPAESANQTETEASVPEAPEEAPVEEPVAEAAPADEAATGDAPADEAPVEAVEDAPVSDATATDTTTDSKSDAAASGSAVEGATVAPETLPPAGTPPVPEAAADPATTNPAASPDSAEAATGVSEPGPAAEPDEAAAQDGCDEADTVEDAPAAS